MTEIFDYSVQTILAAAILFLSFFLLKTWKKHGKENGVVADAIKELKVEHAKDRDAVRDSNQILCSEMEKNRNAIYLVRDCVKKCHDEQQERFNEFLKHFAVHADRMERERGKSDVQ